MRDRPDRAALESDGHRCDVLDREAGVPDRTRHRATSTIDSPASHRRASMSWTPSQLRMPPPLDAGSNKAFAGSRTATDEVANTDSAVTRRPSSPPAMSARAARAAGA